MTLIEINQLNLITYNNMAINYLEYEEIVTMRISCICPNSSSTIEKQEEILDPPGMTLVGFIKTKRNFNRLSTQFKVINHGFRTAPNPHLTLLGLFLGNKKFDPEQENKVHEVISKFLKSREIKI